MTVHVELTPIVAQRHMPDYDPDKGLILKDAAGKTLRRVISDLGIPPAEVSSILVNHRNVPLNTEVKDGDHILLMVIVGGG